jgi:putative ABC transport system ATP-binding protein
VSAVPAPVISVRELSKAYAMGDQRVPVLHGVSLDVMPGEFVALTGPSGSGKSTFMHLLGCLDQPSGGQLLIGGTDVAGVDARALARLRNTDIGFVFQAFNLLPRTSAVENVELPLLYAPRVGARERRERAVRALQAVGLGERLWHHPNQLSGGQQQRVAIARALVSKPTVVFADEPTGNLDSKTGAEILELLREAVETTGQTTVMVTHDPRSASIADRILFLADGNIVKELPRSEPRDVIQAMDEISAT